MPKSTSMTEMLQAIRPEETFSEAHDRLFERVYAELRVIAAALLRRERPDHTLQPTALVHEAYLRLIGSAEIGWECRAHFFGAAARAMRRILVDHARRRSAAKRSPAGQLVSLEHTDLPFRDPQIELVALDDLLLKLGRLDERMARVVELRVFGGLKLDEVAYTLNVSLRTVEGDWAMAKKWLRRELG